MGNNTENKTKILLAEDEPTLAMIISETLADEGFDVDHADDGLEALEKCRTGKYSLVIADVMMPKMNGFDVARTLRITYPELPIVFLTAKSSIEDLVKGFEAGGNDYITKPFKMLELIVRIKALLHRFGPKSTDETESTVSLGIYTFNYSSQTIEAAGKRQQLTHFENELLRILIQWKGRTVSYANLMEGLWHSDDMYNRNSLHGFIHKLRSKLGDDPDIQLVNNRGIGYKLLAP